MKNLENGALKADGTAYSAEEIKAHNDLHGFIQDVAKEEVAGFVTAENAQKMIDDAVTKAGNINEELKQEIALLRKSSVEAVLKLQTKTTNEVADTIKSQLDAVHSEIKASTKKGTLAEVVVKADYLRSSVTNSTQAMRLDTIGQIGNRRLTMLDLFPTIRVGQESNGIIRYTDWDAATTVSAAKAYAESGLYDESTARFQEYSLDLKKIGDLIPISEEAMQDTARLAREVELFLARNCSVIEDTQLLTGSGVGVNWNGLYTSAPTYTAVASGIADASIYDLIVKLSESITSGHGSKYAPNFAVMNIIDINRMKLKKDLNRQYIMPPFATEGGQVIDGLRIIENNGLTANTMVIGDSMYATKYEVEGYNLTFGHQSTQFGEDMISMKGRKRGNLLIREVDKTGFRKVTSISAALTTLAT